MNRMTKLLCSGLLIACATPLWAADSLSLGVVLNGGGWSADNGPGSNNFSSDKGGQFGFNASWARDAYYFGLSLQGGEYQFNHTGPTQFTSTGAIATNDVNVKHSDFDLLAGYYFWEQVSLFIDVKAVSSSWDNNNYKQNFSGLGIGVAGYHPINDAWTLYGSLGFVGGDIKEDGSATLGRAGSSALILAANYALNKQDYLNMGFKSRHYLFDYDDGNEQEYKLSGLFFGYNHVFEF
jgi:hypothetical protein